MASMSRLNFCFIVALLYSYNVANGIPTNSPLNHFQNTIAVKSQSLDGSGTVPTNEARHPLNDTLCPQYDQYHDPVDVNLWPIEVDPIGSIADSQSLNDPEFETVVSDYFDGTVPMDTLSASDCSHSSDDIRSMDIMDIDGDESDDECFCDSESKPVVDQYDDIGGMNSMEDDAIYPLFDDLDHFVAVDYLCDRCGVTFAILTSFLLIISGANSRAFASKSRSMPIAFVVSLTMAVGANAARRRLMDRGPLKPDPSYTIRTPFIERNFNKESVYMDKDCVLNQPGNALPLQKAEHLRTRLLNEQHVQECFKINPLSPLIFELEEEFYFYILKKHDAPAHCANANIDLASFCIEDVRYGRVYEMQYQPIRSPECSVPQKVYSFDGPDVGGKPTKNKGDLSNFKFWHLRAMESSPQLEDAGYIGYHASTFQDASKVRVYVLDSQVKLDHPEFEHLADKQQIKQSGGGQNVGYPVSDPPTDGHGTFVAGLIVGQSVGVFRQSTVSLRTVNICGKSGCGDAEIDAGLHAVLEDLKEMKKNNKGERAVINLSVGSECGDAFYCDPKGKWMKIFDELTEEGSILVTAAGNDDKEACHDWPGFHPYVIIVGSYNIKGAKSTFSNWGTCVDVWAPGEGVCSAAANLYDAPGTADSKTRRERLCGNVLLKTGQGTSYASPIIAGTVAKLLNARRDLPVGSIKEILKSKHLRHDVEAQFVVGGGYGFRLPCGEIVDVVKHDAAEFDAEKRIVGKPDEFKSFMPAQGRVFSNEIKYLKVHLPFGTWGEMHVNFKQDQHPDLGGYSMQLLTVNYQVIPGIGSFHVGKNQEGLYIIPNPLPPGTYWLALKGDDWGHFGYWFRYNIKRGWGESHEISQESTNTFQGSVMNSGHSNRYGVEFTLTTQGGTDGMITKVTAKPPTSLSATFQMSVDGTPKTRDFHQLELKAFDQISFTMQMTTFFTKDVAMDYAATYAVDGKLEDHEVAIPMRYRLVRTFKKPLSSSPGSNGEVWTLYDKRYGATVVMKKATVASATMI